MVPAAGPGRAVDFSRRWCEWLPSDCRSQGRGLRGPREVRGHGRGSQGAGLPTGVGGWPHIRQRTRAHPQRRETAGQCRPPRPCLSAGHSGPTAGGVVWDGQPKAQAPRTCARGCGLRCGLSAVSARAPRGVTGLSAATCSSRLRPWLGRCAQRLRGAARRRGPPERPLPAQL